MEYYLAVKRGTFETVLMKWMNLEPIILSEVIQKDKYCILTHIYRIQKDSTDDLPFGQQKRHRHREQILDTVGEGEVG